MPEMKDVTATSFGYVIAFLLPGLFGMYGLGFWSPSLKELLKPAVSTDATIGPSFICLLVALAIGLLLSAARHFLFERWVCRGKSLDKDLFANLIQSERLSLFKEITDAHYRYHQFYGGCFFGALIMYSGWLRFYFAQLTWHGRLASFFVFLVLEILLWKSSTSCWGLYVDRGNTVPHRSND